MGLSFNSCALGGTKINNLEVTPGATSLDGFGSASPKRVGVCGGNDPIVRGQQIEPLLEEIGGLRQHEPRPVGLSVWKCQIQVIDPDKARRGDWQCRGNGPPERQGGARYGQYGGRARAILLIGCRRLAVGPRPADDQEMLRRQKNPNRV